MDVETILLGKKWKVDGEEYCVQSGLDKSRRVFWLAVFFCSLLIGGVAQADGLNTPVIVKFDNYYVDEAIRMVADGAGMSWVVSGDVKGSVSRTFNTIKPSKVLDILAPQYNFGWTARRGVVATRAVASKGGIDCRVSYELLKIPLSDTLRILADGCDLKLSVKGNLVGRVSGEFGGTLKEALEMLANQHNFRWEISDRTIKITSQLPK
jgi:hypothetical protein